MTGPLQRLVPGLLLLLASCASSTLGLGRLATLKPISQAGHGARLISASFSGAGSYLVTQSVDGEVKVWDAQFQVVAQIALPQLCSHTGLSGNRRALYCARDGWVQFYDLHTAVPVGRLRIGEFTAAAADGRIIWAEESKGQGVEGTEIGSRGQWGDPVDPASGRSGAYHRAYDGNSLLFLDPGCDVLGVLSENRGFLCTKVVGTDDAQSSYLVSLDSSGAEIGRLPSPRIDTCLRSTDRPSRFLCNGRDGQLDSREVNRTSRMQGVFYVVETVPGLQLLNTLHVDFPLPTGGILLEGALSAFGLDSDTALIGRVANGEWLFRLYETSGRLVHEFSALDAKAVGNYFFVIDSKLPLPGAENLPAEARFTMRSRILNRDGTLVAQGTMRDMLYSPVTNTYAIVHDSETLEVWQPGSKRMIAGSLQRISAVNGSEQCDHIYAAKADGSLYVLSSGLHLERLIKLQGVPSFIAPAKSCRQLFVGMESGDILTVDLASARVLEKRTGHTRPVTQIKIAESVGLVSADSQIEIHWDQNSLRPASMTLHPQQSPSDCGVVPENPCVKWKSLSLEGSKEGAVIIRKGRETAMELRFFGEHMLYTQPDKYFMASSGQILPQFKYGQNLNLYPFELLDLFLNRPDIIMRSIAGLFDRRELVEVAERYSIFYQTRIWNNGLSNAGGRMVHIPSVQITSQRTFPVPVSSGELRLSFSATDESQTALPIVGYKVFMNGVPLYGDYIKRTYPGTTRIIHGAHVELEENLRLSQGLNKVEVSAFTEDGVESPRESLVVTYSPQALRRPDLYVVSVGVDEYEATRTGGLDRLTFAVKDAKEVAQTFQQYAQGRYGQVFVKTLANGEVTRESIGGLKQFLGQSQVDDTVIVFLAGHGIRKGTKISDLAGAFANSLPPQYQLRDGSDVDDVYYYMTPDSNVDRPWERAVPLDGIREIVNGIGARQKIMLVDTCQSGEKLELDQALLSSVTRDIETRKTRGLQARGALKLVTARGNRDERGLQMSIAQSLARNSLQKEMSELFPELRRGTGTIEISAAAGAQSALESGEWQNGAFTFVIKEAVIQGKAKDANGNITAQSLRQYVLERVEQLTDGQQTPMVARDIVGRDFVIFGK